MNYDENNSKTGLISQFNSKKFYSAFGSGVEKKKTQEDDNYIELSTMDDKPSYNHYVDINEIAAHISYGGKNDNLLNEKRELDAKHSSAALNQNMGGNNAFKQNVEQKSYPALNNHIQKPNLISSNPPQQQHATTTNYKSEIPSQQTFAPGVMSQNNLVIACPNCSTLQATSPKNTGLQCYSCKYLIPLYTPMNTPLFQCFRCRTNVLFTPGSSSFIMCSCGTVNDVSKHPEVLRISAIQVKNSEIRPKVASQITEPGSNAVSAQQAQNKPHQIPAQTYASQPTYQNMPQMVSNNYPVQQMQYGYSQYGTYPYQYQSNYNQQYNPYQNFQAQSSMQYNFPQQSHMSYNSAQTLSSTEKAINDNPSNVPCDKTILQDKPIQNLETSNNKMNDPSSEAHIPHLKAPQNYISNAFPEVYMPFKFDPNEQKVDKGLRPEKAENLEFAKKEEEIKRAPLLSQPDYEEDNKNQYNQSIKERQEHEESSLLDSKNRQIPDQVYESERVYEERQEERKLLMEY